MCSNSSINHSPHATPNTSSNTEQGEKYRLSMIPKSQATPVYWWVWPCFSHSYQFGQRVSALTPAGCWAGLGTHFWLPDMAASRHGCCQYLCPWVSSNLSSPLWETLQNQQVGLAQASIKLLFLSSVPRACEILYVPFKVGVSISHNPLALPKLNPAGLQSQMFQGFIFWV